MSSLFKEVNNENINEYCLSIDRCRLNLTSIYFILDSYEIIRNDPEKGITLLNAQLDGVSKTIESEKSYKLFCELIDGEFYIGDVIIENDVPLFQLIKGIKETSIPYYPWQNNESNSLIYEDEVESSFFNDLENTKNKTVEGSNYSLDFEFDKTFLSIIKEMKKFPRSREVLNLYQNILLMKDFVINENFIKDFEYSFGEEDKKNEFYLYFSKKLKEAAQKGVTLFEHFPIHIFSKSYKDSSEEDKQKFIKSAMDTPRALFLAHFYAAGINISKKLSLNSLSGIKDSSFKELQIRLINFAQKLFEINQKFGSTLKEINNYYHLKHEKEEELNELINDVLTFFATRDFNWEKEKFPTSRKLSSMTPGGPGIRKRINKIGGLNSFKIFFDEYTKNMKKGFREKSLNSSPTIETNSKNPEKKNSAAMNLKQIKSSSESPRSAMK